MARDCRVFQFSRRDHDAYQSFSSIQIGFIGGCAGELPSANIHSYPSCSNSGEQGDLRLAGCTYSFRPQRYGFPEKERRALRRSPPRHARIRKAGRIALGVQRDDTLCQSSSANALRRHRRYDYRDGIRIFCRRNTDYDSSPINRPGCPRAIRRCAERTHLTPRVALAQLVDRDEVTFVHGVGRWQHDVSIVIPSRETV